MKARWIGLGIGAALCLAACGDAARPAVVEGSASPADATAGAGIVAAATAPYARAERALAAGRILAPAGDNAIEHYLDACAQPSERVRARAALAELQPYVLIAAEQAIARGDGREAARLQALIARIDSGAPALPRLRAGLDALVRAREARDADGAAAAMPSPAAGASAAVVERIVATAATESETSPARAPEPPPAAAPVAATVQAPPPSALPTPPASRGVEARTPRLLQDAQPRYPLSALRARIEGEAQVAFTIQPDGSVRNARLLSSTPPGMFEASALAVAQRWRFEATGRAHDSRRTVHFRLPPEAARDG
ncbi:energy transducer TonB [Pseudoxanthomonas mexicana]|uniref:energy transducer TonB n=1 Tax=Pseudoxanthomonas mexicana TaxID=128785 RepID=UPI0022F3DA21|nr:energy transducer TonB [Pseudoxanthomonas mexicana]WBX94414.1 energy transducer TonB [Pseudoxanthomonas mexicana]